MSFDRQKGNGLFPQSLHRRSRHVRLRFCVSTELRHGERRNIPTSYVIEQGPNGSLRRGDSYSDYTVRGLEDSRRASRRLYVPEEVVQVDHTVVVTIYLISTIRWIPDNTVSCPLKSVVLRSGKCLDRKGIFTLDEN